MKLVKIFVVCVVFSLLIGCTTPPLAVPLTDDIPQTATRTKTPPPLTTPTSPKLSFEIQSYCPAVSLATGQFPDLIGTLVLSGDNILINDISYFPESTQKSLILFWEVQSGDKKLYQLPENHQYYYYVTSPDKDKLAFMESKTLAMQSDVIILNEAGEESGEFILPDDWNLFDWLNNDQLLVRQTRFQKDKNELITLNPMNGEKKNLPANFPNLYSNETLIVWGALTIFDPTGSYVLYPKLEANGVIPILWDVGNNKEIATVISGSQPRWSPDGEQLLIVANYKPVDFDHEDIFLVKTDGSETRATFFKDHLDTNRISLPVWSPNGRYVAFWLSDSTPIETAQLAILDIETLTIDLYCNELNPFPFRHGAYNTLGYSYEQVNSAPPIWSPDNQYLLIENYEQFTSSVYLFDLSNHTVTQIAENARPVSWLK